ncbi:hypothetical protein TorRG33x02_101760 [Trema orientale]|uniref:Uncharacterized protein n=1 Tax=Trema orientale TaxID=63057 RepID=A0A2P5F8M7_TREOI|nr:hypothetical protein TorRG33x02_101760 [Trema orientale]
METNRPDPGGDSVGFGGKVAHKKLDEWMRDSVGLAYVHPPRGPVPHKQQIQYKSSKLALVE